MQFIFRNNEIILEDFQWKLLEIIEKVGNVYMKRITAFHGKHIVFSNKECWKIWNIHSKGMKEYLPINKN